MMLTHNSGSYYQRWRGLLRSGWLAVAIGIGLLLLIGIPLRYRELVTVTPAAVVAFGQLRPQDLIELNRLGLAVQFYALYFTLAEALTSLVFIVTAVIIYWRRSEEWIALFVATVLLLLPSVLPLVSSIQRAQLLPFFLLQAFQATYFAFLGTFLFVFPNGQVVPRKARLLILALVVYALATLIFPSLLTPVSFGAGVTPDEYLPLGLTGLIYMIGLGGQIYRYFRVSTPTQRQQTKLVVFGLAVFCFLAALGIALLFPPSNPSRTVDLSARMIAPILVLFALLAIPLSIGFSILRYRLYDIDIIIRRTATYALVVGLLLAVYFGSVIGLQQIFANLTGVKDSEIVTVLSTLAIAALFVPLRNRIQNEIDKRFNRKKYDAQQVLQDFGNTVRDETDLEKLTGRLMQVVEETMQPKSVTLWLKQEEKRSGK